MDKRNYEMIQQLVRQIEQQLGWGSGEEWSNKDFEALSEQILERTKKRLSVTTLKRIWGRAELVANPSLATLDILSEFVGEKNWREYSKSQNPKTLKQTTTVLRKRVWQVFLVAVMIFVALIIRSYTTNSKEVQTEKPPMDKSLFTFESKVVSTGLPNSVVFAYDASSAGSDAQIQIQQNWDYRKRIQVSQKDSIATCIYYRPGFFKSKLVVNESIVREDDVFITSDGWLGMIDKDSIPIYLGKDEIMENDEIGVDLEAFSSYQIDPKVEEVTSSLYFVDDFSGVYTDDFKLSLEVKNNLDKAIGGCQEVEVYMLYDGGAIGIPLARKGCISKLNLMAFDQYINGKKNDLSAFGVEFELYQKLSFGAEGDVFKVWVNEDLAYEMPVDNPAKAIKGISVHFAGTGAIKNIILKNTKNTSYRLDENLTN